MIIKQTPQSQPFYFDNDAGQRLAGRLDIPDNINESSPTAIFAHCFTGSKNLKQVRIISHALRSQGFAVLRFDFTGLGESEGDFSDTNFSSNVADITAAANALRIRHAPPKILIGHSLGGTASLLAAEHIPECKAVSTIGSPCDPAHVKKLFADSHTKIEINGEALVTLAGRQFRIRKQFLEDVQKQNVEAAVARLHRAILIFHSPIDEVVDIKHAGHLYSAAKHPKSFISLDKADHMLTNANDARYVGNVIAMWASRYI
ncbi:MAG: alpha/beta hydrolase [Mariprofundales bacterium]